MYACVYSRIQVICEYKVQCRGLSYRSVENLHGFKIGHAHALLPEGDGVYTSLIEVFSGKA